MTRFPFTLPTWRDWLFGLKTFAAAMMAFGIAVAIDLPRPYWAMGTVFITTQVLAGATRAKALYRVGGTLIGAAVAVVLVPNLVNAPELLCLAIACWVALCLYLSLLDRTPASYLPMLGGYTAALIGFPAVSTPAAIFDLAVARAEEITLGILCASLVSTLVLPDRAAPVIADRLARGLADARSWMVAVLRRAPASETAAARRLRLAADALGLDALGAALRYDTAGRGRIPQAVPLLRQHMLMVLPIVDSIADRIAALAALGAMPGPVTTLLDDMAGWLVSGVTAPAMAERMRARIRALDPPLGPAPTWADLVRASLVARLLDFVDLRQDARLLERHMAEGRAVKPQDLRFGYTASAHRIRHRDHGMALRSAIGAMLATLLASAMWIATGWPDGAGAPMMAAVACSFFAAQDDPAPMILGFANSALLGAALAGVYLFAILPYATSLPMVALALAPWLVVCGVFMRQPRTAPLAMGTAVNGATTLALTSTYTADFAAFANSAIAVLVGMWTAAIVTRLVRSVGAGRSAERLHRLNRHSLGAAARLHGTGQGIALAALMLDRVGLIAPRLAALPPGDAAFTADLVRDVRIGLNLVEVRRMRLTLAGAAQASLDHLLASVAHHFQAPPARLPEGVRADIDALLHTVAASPQAAEERHGALVALTGLRRALCPEAPAYTPARAPAAQEHAA